MKVDEAAAAAVADGQESDPCSAEQTNSMLERSTAENESNNSMTTDDEEHGYLVNQENNNSNNSNRIRPPRTQPDVEFPSYLLLGAFLIVIFGVGFAVTVSFINSLKTDIELLRDKVHVLEADNRMMKIRSEFQVEQRQQLPPTTPDMLAKKRPERPAPRPKTKTVFNGESEESIQILDKENQIPDFCFFTDENDLFADYNKELCDRLRSGSKKQAGKQPKQKKDKKHRSKIDDDYMLQQTIDSIKRDIEYNQERKNKSEKAGKKKKSKTKQQDDNWMEQRAKSREQFRQSERYRDEDENWYLKRRTDKLSS